MTTKTVICHFYNEEYLLPWWLRHHGRIFDHGIMINYASTDRSCDIIREMCPTWRIVDSRNPEFGPIEHIDSEVVDHERTLTGARICLNVTEFLYGDYGLLDAMEDDVPQQIIIPCRVPVDDQLDRAYDTHRDLIEQCSIGVSYRIDSSFRKCRSAHNHVVWYPNGRHFEQWTTEDLVIFWHGFAPMNEDAVARKLQIGTRISEHDLQRQMGQQHRWSRDEWISRWQGYLDASHDMTDEIRRMLDLHRRSLAARGR